MAAEGSRGAVRVRRLWWGGRRPARRGREELGAAGGPPGRRRSGVTHEGRKEKYQEKNLKYDKVKKTKPKSVEAKCPDKQLRAK